MIDHFLPYIIVPNVADYDLKIYEVTNRYLMISNMAFCHLRGFKGCRSSNPWDIVKGVSVMTPLAISVYTFELNNEQFYVEGISSPIYTHFVFWIFSTFEN